MTPTLLTATYAGNHTVRLRFGDGVEGEVDLSHNLSEDVFVPLRDVAFFQQFRVDRSLGTLVWPNGAQFAPELLYQQVRERYQQAIGSPATVPYASAWGNPSADDGHVKSIAICHFVWGGLLMLFSSLFIFYIVIGAMMVNGSIPMPATPGAPGPPPAALGYMFVCMGVIAILLGWSVGILNIVSGRRILQRRWRVFSLVMGGVNCISFPLGTTLGVFTFIVLLRPSVIARYQPVA